MYCRSMIAGVLGACVLVLCSAQTPAATGSSTVDAVTRLEAQNQSLRAELQEMKNRLDRVEAEKGEVWLNERRAEEVKALIADVLSDADMRASLLDESMTAGHNGGNFFLRSPDGNFLLKIAGQVQLRAVANWADDPFVDNDTAAVEATPGDPGSAAIPGTPDGVDDEALDEGESGFSLHRMKLSFSGHVTANPKIDYLVLISGSRNGGRWGTEIVALSHEFANGLKLTAGQFKLPFLREELAGTAKQLSVEYGSATQYFTLQYAQAIELAYRTDNMHLAAAISDGANMPNVDFIGDGTDMAFTARADLKLAGDWAQAKDFSAWSGEDFGAFVGGAVHWQAAETGTTATNDAMLVWTADGLVEYRGVSAMAAVMGMHTNNEAGPDFDDTGFQVELGCFLIPDKLQPFARYDYIDVDGADEMNLVAAGVNYYLAKHNAKFTADVVHAFDPLFSGRGITDPASSALGLRPDVDGQGGQTALIAQFQLLF